MAEKIIVHRKDFLEAIQRLRLLDDEFFHSCFEGRMDCMELLLRIILKKPFLIVTEMHAQQEVPNIFGREVAFDVFAHDADGTEYNIEVQRDDRGAIPKRARFHACMMDMMHVEKGTPWRGLPPNVIIFITENDVMGAGLPLYHVERTIRELHGKRFEDASDIIYVNASYQDDTPLGWLLHDFWCTKPEDMHYQLLAERANFFKKNEHGVRQMSKIMEEIERKGIAKATFKFIRNQLRRRVPYQQIAEDTDTPVDEVIRIAKENGLAY